MTAVARRRVIIVGGGFGGLACARALKGEDLEVMLIDKSNHHLFQPLLYQVASAGLSPNEIATPLRHVLRGQPNATVVLGEVESVDATHRAVVVVGADGHVHRLSYDWLVIAAGMTNSWFGKDGDWAPHAPGLKDLGDALELRRRVLLAFEKAEWCEDPERRRQLLTFVVVGAGPTGVEMAGALAEISRRSLTSQFRRIRPEEARVVLIEGGASILPAYPSDLRSAALSQIHGLGIETRLSRRVVRIDSAGVQISDGSDSPPERISSATVVWAAGLKAAPLTATVGTPLDRAGRLEVGQDLSVPGHPEIFAIGDLAAARNPEGELYPGVAQNAIQGGEYVAGLIISELAGRGGARAPYRYKDLGSMATIGRSKAIAQIGRVHLSGFIAWLLWLFVHLMALVGFRNRVAVLMEWGWSYMTWQRQSRLIRSNEVRALE
jgi:NADH dehydrogenase